MYRSQDEHTADWSQLHLGYTIDSPWRNDWLRQSADDERRLSGLRGHGDHPDIMTPVARMQVTHRTGLRVSSLGSRIVGGWNAREIQKLILMQILMFIRTFEMHRLWKIVHFAAVNAA